MRRRTGLFGIIALVALAGPLSLQVAALEPQTDPFQRTWQRTDQPVAAGAVSRTWMWGPGGFSASMYERYADSPDEMRVVQYFDKSRMEITHPDAVDDGLWYVTNGLLVVELITGRMQVGDAAFEQREPARVNVAGDPDTGPTYSALQPLLDAPAVSEGAAINQRLHANGTVVTEAGLANRAIAAGRFVPETNHTVAQPFWEFMNSSGIVLQNDAFAEDQLFINPYYATGFPITEAYWTRVTVLGTPKDVLFQCFERRCLTYTPDNPSGWQVEMGNVGQHYYRWRYGVDIPSEPPALDGVRGQDYVDLGPALLYNWPIGSSGESSFHIANQSPYRLTIRIAGPASYSTTLEPCPGCAIDPDATTFQGCDRNLQYVAFTLPPGNYRVEFDYEASDVIDAKGYWTTAPNGFYAGCYFLTQSP